jgi:hypothetical protein
MNGFVSDWALSQRSGRKAVRCKLCGAEFRLGYREYGYWDRNVVRRRARMAGWSFDRMAMCPECKGV